MAGRIYGTRWVSTAVAAHGGTAVVVTGADLAAVVGDAVLCDQLAVVGHLEACGITSIGYNE